jgi:hypothetical protein
LGHSATEKKSDDKYSGGMINNESLYIDMLNLCVDITNNTSVMFKTMFTVCSYFRSAAL